MKPKEAIEQMDARYALFGLFFAFSNRLSAAGDRFYEEISCKQFFLMACMNLFSDSSPTANELAEVMGCSRQNVKELLNALEKKGLIRYCEDNEDRRKRLVVKTEKALCFAEKYHERETAFMAGLFDGISKEDIRSTFETLSKLEQNLLRF